MAMDVIHSRDAVDAVIAVLRGHGPNHTGGLPPSWFAQGDTETALRTLEHGDLLDYVYSNDDFVDLLPAIYVKAVGMEVERAGISGALGTRERVRVVHVRRRDQTHQENSASLEPNLWRARERYAKTIAHALFNDPKRRLAVIDHLGNRTEANITCQSGTAHVWNHTLVAVDLGGGTPDTQAISAARWLDAWAIAIDSDVHIWTV